MALPELGEITVLAGDSRAIYAGTASGAYVGSVYRSVDNGLTWERLLQGYAPVRALVPAGATIYLGMGMTHHLPFNHPVSYCSETLIFAPPCQREPTQEGGLYYTQNGQNWIRVLLNAPVDPPPPFYSVGAMTVRQGTLYAGSPRGIASIPSTYTSWSRFSHPDSLPANSPRFGRNSILAMEATDSILFALTDSALYAAPFSAPARWREEPMRAKALARLGSAIVAAAADGLLRTRNGGSSWERLGGGAFDVLHASGRRLYGARGSEILLSVDTGETWTPAAPASPAPTPATCLLFRNDTLFAGFSDVTGVFRASSPASPWKSSSQGLRDGIPAAPFFAGGKLGVLLLGRGAGLLDLSANRWSRPPGLGSLRHLAISGTDMFVAGGDSLWTLDHTNGSTRLLRTFTGDAIDGLAAAGDALILARRHRLYRCPLGSGDCEEVAPGLIPPYPTNEMGGIVSTFRGLSALQGTLYALYRRLYRSSDEGKTWEEAGFIDSAWTIFRSIPGAFLLGQTEYRPQHSSRLLFRLSTDGRQWRDLPPLEVSANFYGAAGKAGDLLVAAGGTVYRLQEGETAWTALDNGPIGTISAIASDGPTLAAVSSDNRLFVQELEGVGVRRVYPGGAIRGMGPARGPRWRLDGRRLPGG